LAEDNTNLGGASKLREGLVLRVVSERVNDDAVRGRVIAKFIGDCYLTRDGGSEFEYLN
jgi:hypothetical protein